MKLLMLTLMFAVFILNIQNSNQKKGKNIIIVGGGQGGGHGYGHGGGHSSGLPTFFYKTGHKKG